MFKLSKRMLTVLVTCALLISLVGATAYVWFFRITTPIVYGESLEFWYSDETLNGAWLKVGAGQTMSRPTVDLTKGEFDVKLLANNTSSRPVGVRVEIRATDTATENTTNFIGFNVTNVGFSWGTIVWEQTIIGDSTTMWNIRYVLSGEAPPGYTGFSIDWSVNRFETVEEQKVEFTTVVQGYQSGYNSAANFVIQDNETWVEVWKKLAMLTVDPLAPPSIDFSKYTVIAVFMGERNTGGYSTNIVDIVDIGSSLTVRIVNVEPGSNYVIQVLTQPYHVVQIAKTDKPIFFDITTRVMELP